MRTENQLIPEPPHALHVYEPDPGLVYTIEATARMAGVSRYWILVYYRRGLVAPVTKPEIEGYWFDAEGVRLLRRIEDLRSSGMGLPAIKRILELIDEVERLRAELRFRRR